MYTGVGKLINSLPVRINTSTVKVVISLGCHQIAKTDSGERDETKIETVNETPSLHLQKEIKTNSKTLA